MKFPPQVLDFDHKKRDLKLFEIRRYIRGKWKILLKEVKKCELRCANCHRIKTFSQLRLARAGVEN
mgnify:FL=1